MIGCVKISGLRLPEKHPKISPKNETGYMGGLNQLFVLPPWPFRVSLTNSRFTYRSLMSYSEEDSQTRRGHTAMPQASPNYSQLIRDTDTWPGFVGLKLALAMALEG